MHKKLITLFAVLALTLAACGDDGSADTTAAAPDTTMGDECAVENLNLVSDGTLTVATSEPAFEPWMVDDDPSNGEGFESALIYALAEEMGFSADQVTWTRVGFDEAIAPGAKDFDLNIQQYSITDERDEAVDFSEPYYITQQALVAFSDSEVTNATSIEDLKGYVLGAEIGTTSLDYIEEVIQPDTQAAVYDTNADAKSALDAGQIDAIVFDLPTAYYITAVEMPDTAIVGALPAAEEQADRFGIMLEEGNELKTCVDAAIDALWDDGTIDALIEQWLTQEGDIPELSQ